MNSLHLVRRRGDAGSLPFAVLLTVIGMAFSGVLASTVLTQIKVTGDSGDQVRALGAAQAGMDIGLAHLRAAYEGQDTDGNRIGDPRDLPCTLTGTVDTAGTARYEVRITYVTSNPVGRSDAWLDTAYNQIACTPGNGIGTTPTYAVLRVRGTGVASGAMSSVPNRSLRATYTFKQTNANVSGGLVHVYPLAGTNLCMRVASVAANTPLRVATCLPDDDGQTFVYNETLNLVLASTLRDGPAMCLQGSAVTGSSTANVTLQQCAATTQRNQQWGFNSAGNFMGVTSGGSSDGDLASYCLNVVAPLNRPGQNVVTRNNCEGPYDNQQTWSVDTTVGAGMAGDLDRPGFDWLVNYEQFGRCADVTHGSVIFSGAYLIVWPCKQEPNGAVGWNQRFILPNIPNPDNGGTGRITTNPGILYCLRSPLSTAANQYVWLQICPPGNSTTDQTRWLRFEEHADPLKSYTIRDDDGYCLQPTDAEAPSPNFHNEGFEISKIIVAICDGSYLQKWNAPPQLGEAVPLTDIGENLGEN